MAQKQKWSLVALVPDIDRTTASDELFVSVLIAFAQWESKINGERQKRAWQRRASRVARSAGSAKHPMKSCSESSGRANAAAHSALSQTD
jgi:DNA invertase Pin-like site-specific DNA recombinase